MAEKSQIFESDGKSGDSKISFSIDALLSSEKCVNSQKSSDNMRFPKRDLDDVVSTSSDFRSYQEGIFNFYYREQFSGNYLAINFFLAGKKAINKRH